jgi:hypothetical protein
MKKLLNVLFLVLCLAAGFALASAWRPLKRWWYGPGFEASAPRLITGVGDAPASRGFTLAEPPADAAKTFDAWQKLHVTALGIRQSEAWTHQALAATVKAAHDRGMTVTLMPGGAFSPTNPYPQPLEAIAAEAQAAKIDRLCIAWLDVAPDPGYWEPQIAAVRKIFHGSVILATTDRVAPAVTCWDLSDYLGIAGPIMLPRRLPHASDEVTYHDLRLGWESQLTALESLGRTRAKQLMLLNVEVPLAFPIKLSPPDVAPWTPKDNPELQALAYEALLAETKGRAATTDTLLLAWGGKDGRGRDGASAISGLLAKVAEAWDPKKPRTPETAPDQFTGVEMGGEAEGGQ